MKRVKCFSDEANTVRWDQKARHQLLWTTTSIADQPRRKPDLTIDENQRQKTLN